MYKPNRIVLILLALVLVLSSCGGGGGQSANTAVSPTSSPTEASSPDATPTKEGGEFTIFARTGPDSSEWLRIVAEKFTAETDIKVNFIEQGQSGYFTNLTNQLVGGASDFDLGVTNSTYIGPWASAGYLEPLDDYIANFPTDYDMDDLAFSYEMEGKTYAIPYSISAHLFYYRSDLIESPPETWEEMIELARKNTKSLNPDSQTSYGLAWTAKAGPEQPKTWYNYLWSLGGDIAVDGKAAVASEAGIKAGEYWSTIVSEKLAPPDLANYSYSETLEALQLGTIAMAGPYWSAAYGDIQKSDSPYKDVIKTAVMPGAMVDGKVNHVSFNHAYTLVLNAKGPNKDNAMKFYEFLCSKDMQVEFGRNIGVPARHSALEILSSEGSEFFKTCQESLAVTRYEPLVPYYLEQHDIMNIALSGILTQTATIEQALQDAQESLQELFDQNQ